MATIAGSQFTASVSNSVAFPGGVNVVLTGDGTTDLNGNPLGSDTVTGDFNLEVYNGPASGAPTSPAAGYQGLAILTPGGYTIDLKGDGYAITDNGTGGATLIADGNDDTVSGGPNFDNLILNGTGDVANGSGSAGDYIEVNGAGDTVNGGTGPEAINVNSSGNTINAGSGADSISLTGNNNVVNGGSGPDTINGFGTGETVNGGTGPDAINLFGAGSVAHADGGNDTINVFADGSMVFGGSGTATFGIYSNNDSVTGGSGPSTITITGTGDTVTAGSGNMNIGAFNGNFTFNDSANQYADTISGFSQAAGDRIHLTGGDTVATTAPQNGGQDTLITLSDNSTILLKGVSSVDNSFFS